MTDLLAQFLASAASLGEQEQTFPTFPTKQGGEWEEQASDAKGFPTVSTIPTRKQENHTDMSGNGAHEPAQEGSRSVSSFKVGKMGKVGKPYGVRGSVSHLEPLKVGKVGSEDEGVLPVDLPPAAAWRAAMGALSPLRDPCPGFRARDWAQVYQAGMAFLDAFGEQAAAFDWTTLELFGVHPDVGMVRVDCAGALMLTHRASIVAITRETIRYENGLTYRRSPVGPAVAVWDFGSRRPRELNRAA